MQQGIVSVSGSNSVAVPRHGKKSRRGGPYGNAHSLCAMCTALCCAHCLLLYSQPLAILLLVYIPLACSLKSPVYSLWTSGKYFCSIYRLIQFTHFELQTSLCLPVLTGYGPHLLEVSSLFFRVSLLHLSPSAALFFSYSVCDLCNQKHQLLGLILFERQSLIHQKIFRQSFL